MTHHSKAVDDDAPAEAAPRRRSPAAVLDALVIYFAVALTMSALLEPVGAFFVRAGADPIMALSSLATAILLVLLWAAGWVVEGFEIPPRTGVRLAVGLGAMALLLASGLVLALLILGVWPWEFARQFANGQGAVIAVSLALGALLPLFRARGSGV